MPLQAARVRRGGEARDQRSRTAIRRRTTSTSRRRTILTGTNRSRTALGPLTHKLNVAEAMVPVKCNQHPWMKAYVGVFKHPFFAVSAADGTFTIKGVPPGTYTVVAWHEGRSRHRENDAGDGPGKGSANADFSFRRQRGTTWAASSLPMLPAIEFPMLHR